LRRSYKNINIDYDKIVEVSNSNGKVAAQEFVKESYELEYDYVCRKLLKETDYFYNRSSRKYELKSSGEAQFMSLDELCKDKGQKPVKKSTEVEPNNLVLETIIVDLMKDRIVELSKYIHIEQSTKKIVINMQSLERAGYQVSIL
jgi:hypothetical protein